MTPIPAIEHNRNALLRLWAVLVRSLGDGATLPRYARNNILRLLRPAESAVRRLIVSLACMLELKARTPAAHKAWAASAATGSKHAARPMPFPLFDRRKCLEPPRRHPPGIGPRLHVFGSGEAWPSAGCPCPLSDDPVGAETVLRRLQSLKAALDDLPKQARRLVRIQARRALAPPGPRRLGPLRPGRPPGMSARRSRRVDEILGDCNALARLAPRPPNTS